MADTIHDFQTDLFTSIMNEVAPVMKDILMKHIETDIYGAYTPIEGGWVNGTTYERRGSLLDEGNLTVLVENGDTIVVTSVATPNESVVPGHQFVSSQPGAFLQLLESGRMGIWRHGFARPAVRNAQDEINNSSKIEAAILKGIQLI